VGRMVGTNLQNVPENVCSHKSLQCSTTRETHTINAADALLYYDAPDYLNVFVAADLSSLT